jgi:hypothetical protein
VTAPSRQSGQGPDPLVARIAAELADIPRCPINPDRELLLAEGYEMYSLWIRREISITGGYWPAERPPLPEVSASAFDVLAHRHHPAEPPTASWNGGPCCDAELPIGRALISDRTELHAAVDELLPLLRWCRTHTRLVDVCELIESDGGVSS